MPIAHDCTAPFTNRNRNLSSACRRNALLGCAVLALATSAPAAIPSAEKVLPQDTLFVLTAPDFVRLQDAWTNSPGARCWNDPAMKAFRDKLLTKLKDEFVQPLERDLGVRLADFAGLPQGQLTLALTQNGWNGSGDAEPALLLLLDSRDKKDQLKKLLDELRAKWVETGKSIRKEKIRGAEFSIVSLSNGDVPDALKKLIPGTDASAEEDDEQPASKRELTIGQFESLLIAGDSVPAVEKVMARLTGGGIPALGELESYETSRVALFRDSPLYGWANFKTLIEILVRSSEPGGEDDEMPTPMSMFNPGKMVNALGMGGLRTLAFNLQMAKEGSFVQVFVSVPESSRQGLLKLFPASGKEAGPPPFVPADVMKFSRWRVEGQKVWTTFEQVLKDINPQLISSLNMFLDMANASAREKDPDFDIRKNLFGNLGDDMMSYQKAPRPSSDQKTGPTPTLVLLSSPNPEQLAVALKTLATLFSRGATVSEREFLGRKIYSLPLPGSPSPSADSGNAAPRTLQYAATSAYVALSSDVVMLEDYLRSSDSQQKKLRELAGLTEAGAKAGGTSTGWFVYENQADSARVMFDQLRKLGSAEPRKNEADSEDEDFGPRKTFKDWVDFSLLPPFDKVARYFHFTVQTAGATPDGLTFKWFAPTPPTLRK